MPKGIKREREPFYKFLKNQANYEKNYYAVEIIAVKNNKYLASTDLEYYPKAEPHKARITSFARDLILRPSLICSGVKSPDSR